MRKLTVCVLVFAAACGRLPGVGGKTVGTGGGGNKIQAHDSGADGVAISPDGKLVASGGRDNLVKLWDLADRKVIATLEGHTGAVRGLAFSPDGKTLVTGDENKTVKVWDVAARKETRSFEVAGAVTRIVFAPDGSRFYVGSGSSTISTVAGTAEPVAIRHENELSNSISDLAVSSDGKQFIGIDSLGITIVYDQTGTPGTKVTHAGVGSAVAFAPAGGFYTAGLEGSARLWDAAGVANAAFKCPEALVTTLRLTANGKSVIAGTEDGTVLVLDAASCATKKSFEAHNRTVAALALSPDGTTVVTAGKDGGVGFWSID